MAGSGADGIYIVNGSASSALTALLGGEYGIAVSATFGGGNVVLQMLSLDGSTLITVLPSFTTSGYGSVDLPPGQYQITVTTATAVYAALSRIPKGR
jgi:hypothetical protein